MSGHPYFFSGEVRQNGTMFSAAQLGTATRTSLEAKAAGYRAAELQCLADGDRVASARAALNQGWAFEQLGRGVEGIERAEEALMSFREEGDTTGIADTQHALGIWRFHVSTDLAPVRTAFIEAAAVREAVGELLLSAQSWHNLAYTELASGERDASLSSYGAAEALLIRVQSAGDSALAASADRQRGFVLSHRAYWAARFATPQKAAERAYDYLGHERRTGRPKEAALAYLAMGIALAAGHVPGGKVTELDSSLRLATDPEVWLSRAHRLSDPATALAVGANRPPYLGVHLRASLALARYQLAQERSEAAQALVEDALGRAQARGWPAEVLRLQAATIQKNTS